MKLIVGLGNPGKQYFDTRHNIGFAVVEHLAKKEALHFKHETKFQADMLQYTATVPILQVKEQEAEIAEALEAAEENSEEEGLEPKPKQQKKKKPKKVIEISSYRQEKVILATPTTYMNLSGLAVSKIANFYKIKAEDILVIHDEVGLDLGTLRLTFNRGAGGQHGVEDIIKSLGNNKKFHRLRVGVGPDPGGDMRADYVLGKFTNKQKQICEEVIREAVSLTKDWLAYFGSEHGEEYLSKQGQLIEKANTFVVA